MENEVKVKIKVKDAYFPRMRAWGRNKAIGEHKRKVKGRTYSSPKLILNSEFSDLIGKGFTTCRAKIEVIYPYSEPIENDALIIVLGERQTHTPRKPRFRR